MLPSFFVCSIATPSWAAGLAYSDWPSFVAWAQASPSAGLTSGLSVLFAAGPMIFIRMLFMVFSAIAAHNFGHGLKKLEFISLAQQEDEDEQEGHDLVKGETDALLGTAARSIP